MGDLRDRENTRLQEPVREKNFERGETNLNKPIKLLLKDYTFGIFLCIFRDIARKCTTLSLLNINRIIRVPVQVTNFLFSLRNRTRENFARGKFLARFQRWPHHRALYN